MPSLLFYLFAFFAVAGGLAIIVFRNPVSSALSMVVSFLGLAAVFIGLNAYFIGIVQILVYAGAIMVLFLFVIMLLDLKQEETKRRRPWVFAAAVAIPALFLAQLLAVLFSSENVSPTPLSQDHLATQASRFPEGSAIHKQLASGRLPDVHLTGQTLFGQNQPEQPYQGYNFPLQMAGLILLVSTIGVVTLSARSALGKS